MSQRLKVYVACALTHAPESFIEQVKLFKAALVGLGDVEILEFQGKQVGTALGVYTYDLRQVLRCDLLVHLLEYPSDGGGMEIQTAQLFRIPTLALARESTIVSWMNIGMCQFAPSIGETPYARFERCHHFLLDGVQAVFRYISELRTLRVLPRPVSHEARFAEAVRYIGRFYIAVGGTASR